MNTLINNLGLILGAIGLTGGGGLLGVYLDRKKRKGEVQQIEGNALKTMQEAYTKFTEDSNKKFEYLQSEMAHLKKENIEQRKDIRDLHKDNRSLHNQVTALSNENGELKASIKALENENKRYKQRLKNEVNSKKK